MCNDGPVLKLEERRLGPLLRGPRQVADDKATPDFQNEDVLAMTAPQMGDAPTNNLATRVTRMKKIPKSGDYFALTVIADEAGRVWWQAQTQFAGWADDKFRHELREPSLVYPDKMADCWKAIGQWCVVVRDQTDLAIFFHIGGNALVKKSVVLKSRLLHHWLKPKESAHRARGGFHNVGSLPKATLHRGPTPKQRSRISKRDERRCKICGERPADNVHVQLHLHHIRPWEFGGITEDDNMITICHTCHLGLEPHYDSSLFELIGVGVGNERADTALQEWKNGTRRYQEYVGRLKAKLRLSEQERS